MSTSLLLYFHHLLDVDDALRLPRLPDVDVVVAVAAVRPVFLHRFVARLKEIIILVGGKTEVGQNKGVSNFGFRKVFAEKHQFVKHFRKENS